MRKDIDKSLKHLKEAISKEHIIQTAERLRNLQERAIGENLDLDDFESKFPDLAPLEEFLETFEAEVKKGHVDSLKDQIKAIKQPLRHLEMDIFQEMAKSLKIASLRKPKQSKPKYIEVEYKDPN